jgi:hypothetical protein
VFSEGEHFQPGLELGNVAQDEALQEVEDEIAALRQRRRGNVPPASNFHPGAIDTFAHGRLATLLALPIGKRRLTIKRRLPSNSNHERMPTRLRVPTAGKPAVTAGIVERKCSRVRYVVDV